MGARECLFWVAAFSVSEKLPFRFKVLHVKVTRVSVEKYSQRYSDIFQEEGAAPPNLLHCFLFMPEERRHMDGIIW